MWRLYDYDSEAKRRLVVSDLAREWNRRTLRRPSFCSFPIGNVSFTTIDHTDRHAQERRLSWRESTTVRSPAMVIGAYGAGVYARGSPASGTRSRPARTRSSPMRHLSVVAIVLAISVARALNSPPRPYLRRQSYIGYGVSNSARSQTGLPRRLARRQSRNNQAAGTDCREVDRLRGEGPRQLRRDGLPLRPGCPACGWLPQGEWLAEYLMVNLEKESGSRI